MAFSTAEKIAIAKKISEGKKAQTIAKVLNLPRSSVAALISHPDQEFTSLLSEFEKFLNIYKKEKPRKRSNR